MIYISDLDGTLLDSHGNVSGFTRETIRGLVRSGIKFTVASARSWHSANHIMEELGLVLPVILRNGAVIYDPAGKKILRNRFLGYRAGMGIIHRMTALGLNPIVHSASGDIEHVDYVHITNPGEETYISSRLRHGDRRIRKMDGFSYPKNTRFMALCAIDGHEKQRKAFEAIGHGAGREASVHLYPDNYSPYTWLECNHAGATKELGARDILELTGETEYIAFGDNENDLGMLSLARSAYVTAESFLDAKGHDFLTIPSCDEDGVARKLLELNPVL
ncbi:MAG: HAD family hydrolase [Clostridia bacterium]